MHRRNSCEEVMTVAIVHNDYAREFDRLVNRFWGLGDAARAAAMPMDAYRKGDTFLVRLDLPGVDPDAIELTVEDNVLAVRAERPSPATVDGVERLVSERPYGTFERRVYLGEGLDTEHIEAEYRDGVLSLSIPLSPQAKPRRIQVTRAGEAQRLTS